ncbi:MAG: hypothetical protein ACK5MY_02445 [Jhaorihella sp.]
MSRLDPYNCGNGCAPNDCGCEDDCNPCCENALQLIVTRGLPQGKPNPCRDLPIAYDATTGCLYVWTESSGWFEATGVQVEMDDTDASGRGDLWRITTCSEAVEIVNSRNTSLSLAGTALTLAQTYGGPVSVDLSDIGSYVDSFSITGDQITLTQTNGRPSFSIEVPWDRICVAAEPITDAANHMVLVCGPNGVKKIDPLDLPVPELCFEEPPQFDGCGVAESAVLFEDGGCWKLGIRSTAAKRSYQMTAGQGDVNKPLNQEFVWPDDFGTAGTNYYTTEGLRAADNNGAGTINEALARNNVVAGTSFDLACPTQFTHTAAFSVRRAADADTAYSQATTFLYRWRINGGAWLYPRLPSGAIALQRVFNSLATIETRIEERGYSAGTVDVQLLAVHANAADPTRFDVWTYVAGQGGARTPNVSLTPITSV